MLSKAKRWLTRRHPIQCFHGEAEPYLSWPNEELRLHAYCSIFEGAVGPLTVSAGVGVAVTRSSSVVQYKLRALLGHLPKFHVRVSRVATTSYLARNLHVCGPSVLVMGPSVPKGFGLRRLGSRYNYPSVGYFTLRCGMDSPFLLHSCSSRVSVCSGTSRLGGGLRHLGARRIPSRRKRGRSRRALDDERGRVIVYIMGNVAGQRVTSELCLSARAIVARHQGVTQGLRMRDTDNLAICTVMGGLVRLGSLGNWRAMPFLTLLDGFRLSVF